MKKILFILMLTLSMNGFAVVGGLDLHDAHKKLMEYQQKGKKKEAELLAVQILRQYPKDVDAMVMLAYVYYHNGDFESAQKMVDIARKTDPKDPDIEDMQKLIKNATRFFPMKKTADDNPVLISLLAYLEQLNKVEVLQSAALQPPPPPPPPPAPVAQPLVVTPPAVASAPPATAQPSPPPKPLVKKETTSVNVAQAPVSTGAATQSAAQQAPPTVSVFAPSNISQTNVLNNIVAIPKGYEHLLNQVGLAQQSIYATSPDGYWDFTNSYYTRKTDFGMVIGSVNYASRFGFQAVQGAAEGIINFTDKFYLDVNLAYANNLEIFPNWTVGAEGYVSLYKDLQVSVGDLYKAITPSYFNTYTGSIQKYYGDYLFIFRPYFYVPNEGDISIFYTASARLYIDGDVDHSLVVTLGYGKTPDLADLQSLNFIIVQDRSIAVDYLFPLLNHTLLLDVGLSYENQRFPSGFIRQLSGANVGIRYRF